MQWFQRLSHLNGLKCLGQRILANSRCDLLPLKKFFLLIFLNNKVQITLHTKFQAMAPAFQEKKLDLIGGFAIFSTLAILDS